MSLFQSRYFPRWVGILSCLPFILLTTLFLSSCAHQSLSDHAEIARVSEGLWQGDNAKKINTFMRAYQGTQAVAIFDWDNTVIKNDLGDATFFWLLKNDGIRRPASWKKQSPDLTAAAVKDLNHYCPTKAGKFIETSENKGCADLILSIYLDGKTKTGKAKAWHTSHSDLLEPAHLWAVQLMAGYSLKEVQVIADQVIEHDTTNPIGTTQFVGSREVPGYVRLYDAQKHWIESLKANGFEVWVVSASAQALVEVFAAQVGIEPGHVIGVRPIIKDGVLTDTLEGCGPFAEGNREIMTYRQGMRCFINKIVFKVTDPKMQMEAKSPSALAVGDSDTDVFFVKDANYHLVINRNPLELMCNALQNSDQHWIINSMFLEPNPKLNTPYVCTKYGILDQHE